jgi:hypothetical protein
MIDYLLLMHGDANRESGGDAWGPYLAKLKATGNFEGGSSIGGGVCVNKSGTEREISARLVGFIKVRARNLEHAREYLDGNPVYEAGGTVEIRELPRD